MLFFITQGGTEWAPGGLSWRRYKKWNWCHVLTLLFRTSTESSAWHSTYVPKARKQQIWLKNADWEDWKQISVVARPLFANEEMYHRNRWQICTKSKQANESRDKRDIDYSGNRSVRINYISHLDAFEQLRFSAWGNLKKKTTNVCSSHSRCHSPQKKSDGVKSM